MARNTITDVREQIARLNEMGDKELTFECWGTGTNKYYLANAETGARIGDVYEGATNFLAFLHGYKAKLRREK